jgi:cyclase
MIKEIAHGVFAETDTRGCNPGFVVTSEGVVVIDTPQLPASAVRMRKQAEEHGPIKYLINTEHHVDHIFGNYFFNGAGTVVAHRRVLEQFMVVYPEINPFKYAKEAVPTNDPDDEAFFPDQKTYFENMNKPTLTFESNVTLRQAVFIPERKVLFTGDTIFNGVQTWHYASNIEQWISSLRNLKKLDAKIVVPGHGPVCTLRELDTQISFLYEWLAAVSKCMVEGKTKGECVQSINFRERFPVDIGQEYMLDHVIEHNVSALYDKLNAKD